MSRPTAYNVLVVEDNTLNLELVSDLLEAAGHKVVPARTAEEGLRLAEQFVPDIVLMDLSLPGMDGLAAAKALRANPGLGHLPIIALTAHAMKGDEQSALNAGCNGYMVKPIDTRTFAATVAEFIGTAKIARGKQQLALNV